MKKKNCPNCGAPYDVAENKCPYCGTCCFDMSCIDLSKQEPFYLKIKLPYMNHNIYLTQKVVPDLSNCTFEREVSTVSAYDRNNNTVTQYIESDSFNTSLAFHSVVDGNSLFNIQKE